MCRLISLQRIVAIAITSALCSTATDSLDLHANLLPVDLLLYKICHCMAVLVFPRLRLEADL